MSVGASNWGEAFGKAAEGLFKAHRVSRMAEDEVALERLQQSLLDDELDSKENLDQGAGGIAYKDFVTHAEGRHQENVAGFLADPAIQNLLTVNQTRMDKMLLASRGVISRNARRTASLKMVAELNARETGRETRVIDNVSTHHNVLEGLELVDLYY